MTAFGTGDEYCVPVTPTPEPAICDFSVGFRAALIDEPDPAKREACLKQYADVIYLTIYHETGTYNLTAFGPSITLAYVANAIQSESEQSSTSPLEVGSLLGEVFQTRPGAIVADDVDPFANSPATDDYYYIFARAIINGMKGYAGDVTPSDPMRYFAHNFNSAVSNSNAYGSSLCEASDQLDLDGTGARYQPACTSLIYWSGVLNRLVTRDETQARLYIRASNSIERAIHDASYIPEQDPTDGAIGSRPVNLYRGGYGLPPLVFRTYVTNLTQFVPPTPGNASSPATAPDIESVCTNQSETITQAYLRNLQLILAQSTYDRALRETVDGFTRDEVRFGMGEDISRYLHVLMTEQSSIAPQAPMTFISWQTMRFSRPPTAGDPLIPYTRPISGPEFVPLETLATCTGS